LEAAAISINQQTTDAARKKADAIIAAAEAEARTVTAQAQDDVEKRYAQAKSQLEKIQAERESVEVYLRNLRNVLQGQSNTNQGI
jgi:vacuolar-type H+-ATPase subunit H